MTALPPARRRAVAAGVRGELRVGFRVRVARSAVLLLLVDVRVEERVRGPADRRGRRRRLAPAEHVAQGLAPARRSDDGDQGDEEWLAHDDGPPAGPVRRWNYRPA